MTATVRYERKTKKWKITKIQNKKLKKFFSKWIKFQKISALSNRIRDRLQAIKKPTNVLQKMAVKLATPLVRQTWGERF